MFFESKRIPRGAASGIVRFKKFFIAQALVPIRYKKTAAQYFELLCWVYNKKCREKRGCPYLT